MIVLLVGVVSPPLASVAGPEWPVRGSPNLKGPPSSLVQLCVTVWTGYARDTRPKADVWITIRSQARGFDANLCDLEENRD